MTKELVMILVIAAILRLGFLGLIEFKADEALTVLSLQEVIEKPRLIEAGLVSSTGARNLPLFEYLLIPAAIISTDPRFLSGLIGLINVMMIGWFYMVTRREFGDKTAGIASLFLAVAPFPVLYSRKIWAQDLVMLLATPIYDLLMRIRRQPKEVKLHFWLGLLAMLQAQLHASGLFLMMVIRGNLLIKKIKLSKMNYLGLVLGLLPAIPYLWLQVSAEPMFPDFQAYQEMNQLSQKQPDLKHLWLPGQYFTAFGWKEIMGEVDYLKFLNQSPAIGVATLASLMMIVSLVLGVHETFRRKSGRGLPVIVIGLVGMYVVASVPGRLHYYQVVAPYLAVVTAIGFLKMFRTQKSLIWPSLGFVVVAFGLFQTMFFKYLNENQGVSGDYGVSYKFTLPWVNQAIKPYVYREDIAKIRAYAHFDPVVSKFTNKGMIHYNLARYFEMKGETEMAKLELDRAIELDSRFSKLSIGENNDEADKATDN